MRDQGRYMVPAGNDLQAGQEIILEGNEARHLITVKRAKAGDRLELSDGQGNAWRAEFLRAEGKTAVCAVHDRVPATAGPALYLSLATAVPRPKRMTFLVEKCAELGVAELIPVKWKHSPRLGKDAAVDRWRRLAESAAKQSRQSLLMNICEPLEGSQLEEQLTAFDRVLLLDTTGGDTPAGALTDLHKGARVLALVGPEGGFAPEELKAISSKAAESCRRVSLGTAILRVETACVTLAGLAMAAGLELDAGT